MTESADKTGRIADALPHGWVYSYAPAWALPYCQLARLDRPIGTWLLLLPCWWSVALAQISLGGGIPDPWLLILFAMGALVMRGAGCTYNDMIDRDIDVHVARTRSRPIPSGRVTPRAAAIFMVALSLAGLGVLLQFNPFAVLVGISSLVFVAVYPFLKRVTHWPQLGLGLAFNWGALLGWAAVRGDLGLAPVFLFMGGIFWTLAYDTIYAHQDKDDDALIGLKSSALRLGDRTRPWLTVFFALALASITLAGALAGAGAVFYLGLVLAGLHAVYQLARLDIDDAGRCLALFRSNRDFGLIVFAALALDAAMMTAL